MSRTTPPNESWLWQWKWKRLRVLKGQSVKKNTHTYQSERMRKSKRVKEKERRQLSRVVSCTRKIGKRCDVRNMRAVGCYVSVPCLVSLSFFGVSWLFRRCPRAVLCSATKKEEEPTAQANDCIKQKKNNNHHV